MKTILSVIIVLSTFLFSCQTKWNYVDTGISDGRFHGSMYEYMKANPYDWDSTCLLIERAGLTRIFEGLDPDYKEITFLGPTNHSIRMWMREKGITSIGNADETICKEILLRHIIQGKYMRDDIPEGKAPVEGAEIGEGGQKFTTLGGNVLWLYTFKNPYTGVTNTGAVDLFLRSVERLRNIEVGSTNIEPDNGVVHSLGYNYVLGEL